MRILVTNDDGVHSEGIRALAKALSEVGDVFVVAPDRDKSGVGTAMTLLDVLRVRHVSSPLDAVEAYSVEGTPADCVILACGTLFTEPFDLVVSGINPGANLGLDVLSSGTVGGALQAYYREIPSMAVSAVYSKDTEVRYEAASRSAAVLARRLGNGDHTGTPVLNVNVPDVEPEGIQGVEVTRLGPRAFLEDVEIGQIGRRTHYWIKHNKPAIDHPAEGTDVWAVLNNRVSITPIEPIFTDGKPPAVLGPLTEEVRSAFVGKDR